MFYELWSHVFMVVFSFQTESLRSDCAVLILMEMGGLSLQVVILILLSVASLVEAWIFFL